MGAAAAAGADTWLTHGMLLQVEVAHWTGVDLVKVKTKFTGLREAIQKDLEDAFQRLPPQRPTAERFTRKEAAKRAAAAAAAAEAAGGSAAADGEAPPGAAAGRAAPAAAVEPDVVRPAMTAVFSRR